MIKVSAIVSVYKALEFIEGLLEDLVQQSLFKRGQLEIIIVDSNSPQDEKAVIERYQQSYPNIIYHRTAERESLYQAWNRGVQLARAEYVTNANCDDRHHPECIESLSKVLDNRPDVDLVYADVYESSVANQPFHENPRSVRYVYPQYFAPESLLFFQFGCQPLWRKRVHEHIGEFDAGLRATGDWDFCIRFSLAGLRAVHVPQVLGSFLSRPSSISQQDTTSVNEQGQVKKRYLINQSILNLYRAEGWNIEKSEDRARVFTDFSMRASCVKLPWEPGRSFQDPVALIVGCQAAFDEAVTDFRAAWNLGVALLTCRCSDSAKPFLERGLSSRNSKILEAWHAVQRGEMAHLPLLPIE
jgi:glycosyltransferase involved in cell wall biosynthesis